MAAAMHSHPLELGWLCNIAAKCRRVSCVLVLAGFAACAQERFAKKKTVLKYILFEPMVQHGVPAGDSRNDVDCHCWQEYIGQEKNNRLARE